MIFPPPSFKDFFSFIPCGCKMKMYICVTFLKDACALEDLGGGGLELRATVQSWLGSCKVPRDGLKHIGVSMACKQNVIFS